VPASYWIDADSGIVYTRGWGSITDDDIQAHARALRADARFDASFRQVVDFSEVREIRVTSRGVRDVANVNPFTRDARRAFIVATDEAFGLTRMFGFFTESNPDQFGIFRAVAPAFEWVGLPATAVWPDEKPDAIFEG
jgi:hypothetical protein